MKAFRYLGVLGAGLVVLMLAAPNSAFADLVYAGQVTLSGTGFGNVTTVLTMQVTGNKMKSGLESGCVGVDGSGMTVIGPSVCQGDNFGGDEKPPAHFPHNSTPTVSDASQMAIIFNSDQPRKDKGSIALDNLVMALYNASGKPGFISGNFIAPGDFPDTSSEPGIGKSGWAFDLTAPEAAQAQAAIDAGYNILGLSATISDARGGPETFFLRPKDSLGLADSPAPEPASLLLFGTGLLSLGGLVRHRSRSAKKKEEADRN